jgi:hypothetical protein
VLDLKSDVLKVREAQHAAVDSVEDMHEALISHTRQDADQFDKLASLIIETDLAADREAKRIAAVLAEKVEKTDGH